MSTTAKVSIGLFVVIILTQSFVSNAIIAFLFAGVVPGTSYVLPFWAMTLVLAAIGYAALKWLSKDTLYIGDSAHRQQQAKAEARAYVLQHVARSRSKAATKLPKPTSSKRRKRSYQTAPSS